MEDQIAMFAWCPRCGSKAYDRLRTHAYCVECNYSPDLGDAYESRVPQWALKLLKEKRFQRKSKSGAKRVAAERSKISPELTAKATEPGC